MVVLSLVVLTYLLTSAALAHASAGPESLEGDVPVSGTIKSVLTQTIAPSWLYDEETVYSSSVVATLTNATMEAEYLELGNLGEGQNFLFPLRPSSAQVSYAVSKTIDSCGDGSCSPDCIASSERTGTLPPSSLVDPLEYEYPLAIVIRVAGPQASDQPDSVQIPEFWFPDAGGFGECGTGPVIANACTLEYYSSTPECFIQPTWCKESQAVAEAGHWQGRCTESREGSYSSELTTEWNLLYGQAATGPPTPTQPSTPTPVVPPPCPSPADAQVIAQYQDLNSEVEDEANEVQKIIKDTKADAIKTIEDLPDDLVDDKAQEGVMERINQELDGALTKIRRADTNIAAGRWKTAAILEREWAAESAAVFRTHTGLFLEVVKRAQILKWSRELGQIATGDAALALHLHELDLLDPAYKQAETDLMLCSAHR
jgi:hypothetical protein